MACNRNLSKGRKLACVGGRSGFKAFSIAEWSKTSIITGTSGIVSTLPVGLTASYRYEVNNEGSKYDYTYTGDAQTRNGMVDGVLTVILQKLDAETTEELMQVAKKEVNIFIETYDGAVLVVGPQNGNLLVTNLMTTGGAANDVSGYTLTFNCRETYPFLTLGASASAAYQALCVDGL